jgi:porin
VTLKAPLKGRDNDTVGFGFGLTHASGSVADYDEDLSQFTGSPVPVRGSETFFELTYQAQVTPWWTVQPDLQYIVNPGGGLSSPLDPGQKIGNEFVLGLRSNVVF